jgi:hypothetical protein
VRSVEKAHADQALLFHHPLGNLRVDEVPDNQRGAAMR